MNQVLEDQLKLKKDYVIKYYETSDRSHCKNVAETLEKTIRNTLYSSKAQETSFTFPFMEGCGKEVHDMIKTYNLNPMIDSSETLNTVKSLFITFNLAKNKSFLLLTK